MAPSNIAHPDRAYNKFNMRNRFIEGTKYTTERLVKGTRTMHTIVPKAVVQRVGHKPNYRHTNKMSTGKVGYTRRAPVKPTYVKPYTRQFVPRGKDKVQRDSRNLLSDLH